MDNPQGYSQIDNRLIEGLYSSDFSGTEFAVIVAVLAHTWQFRKTEELIPCKRLASKMGRHVKTVEKTVRELKKKNVIYQTAGGEIGINPDAEEWLTGNRSDSAKARSEQAVKSKRRNQKAAKRESIDSQTGNLQVPGKESADSQIDAQGRESTGCQKENLQVATEGTNRLPDQEPVDSPLYNKNINTNKTLNKPDENLTPDGDQAPSKKIELLEKIQAKHPDAAIATKSGGANRWGTAEDKALALQMHEQVVQVTFDTKPFTSHNQASWANEIRLMREQDGRSHAMIWALFHYAHTETSWGLWREQILSPGNLREKWAKLASQYNAKRHKLRTGSELKRDDESRSWGDNINAYE